MKKGFRSYIAVWAILLVVFNVICFVSPNLITVAGTEYDKFGGAFWTGYVFITLAMIGQLACANVAFKAENLKKLFYNIPLIRISYFGMIVMFIAGALVMAIPDLPNWIGIIICVIIVAISASSVIKANAAAEIVKAVDEKVAAKTSYIKNLILDAEDLVSRAKSEAVKTECRKVYEAIRYSDPMSNDALSAIEAKITVKMDELAAVVTADDPEKVIATADEVVLLVKERNGKCKVVK